MAIIQQTPPLSSLPQATLLAHADGPSDFNVTNSPEVNEGLNKILTMLGTRFAGAGNAYGQAQAAVQQLIGGSIDSSFYNAINSPRVLNALQNESLTGDLNTFDKRKVSAVINLIKNLQQAESIIGDIKVSIAGTSGESFLDVAQGALKIAERIEKATKRLANAFNSNFDPVYTQPPGNPNPAEAGPEEGYTDPTEPYKLETYFP